MPLLEKLAHDAPFAFRFADASGRRAALQRDRRGAAGRDARRGARADAILFGAMGWPEIRYPDGTEIAPQLDLRVELDLYAGVRPIRAIPGVPLPLADPAGRGHRLRDRARVDRGLFASRGKGEIDRRPRGARHAWSSRARGYRAPARLRFRLARRRKEARGTPGRVTCVDKANVFRSMAFFRKIFDERAPRFPDIEARHNYVDAMALDLVRKPWDFDVLVDGEHVRRHPVRSRPRA